MTPNLDDLPLVRAHARDDAPLSAPHFAPDANATARIMLAVESFARHMSTEGWQIQEGLRAAGYDLWGRFYWNQDCGDVAAILEKTSPGTVIVQDKREWDSTRPGCFEKGRDFLGAGLLRDRPEVFRVTIQKDLQNDPPYHKAFHEEIGCHAWIVYYHPAVVRALCPWIRPEHTLRTWHTVDAGQVPPFSADRRGIVVSGCLNPKVYPLRGRIVETAGDLGVTVIPFPGYGVEGHATPQYLQTISRAKVSVATASVFGYALRKIIEAVACGCVAVTDLPAWEALPGIDEGLVRVPPDISMDELRDVLRAAEAGYDPERQRDLARRAIARYDYWKVTHVLAQEIAALRSAWTVREGGAVAA